MSAGHAENEGDSGVGFTEDFAEDANSGVEQGDFSDELAGRKRFLFPETDLRPNQEEETLECRLVELGRVAREQVGNVLDTAENECFVFKDNGPGDIGFFAPELAVDEIGDASEEQSCRGERDDDIA